MDTIRERGNTLLLVLILMTGLAIVGMLARGAAGGPLDPPGPVGPTDGVRGPGTPISSIPYEITEPGFYYLTRNVSRETPGDGITVSASAVTLDLNGFQVSGDGAGVGIKAFGSPVIRNGTITNFSTGVQVTAAQVKNIRASNNAEAGIHATGYSILSDCYVSANGKGVIAQAGVVRDCLVLGNGMAGIEIPSGSVLVTRNHIEFNGEDDPAEGGGIVAGQFSHSTVTDNHVLWNGHADVRTADGGLNVFLRNRVECFTLDLGANTWFPLDSGISGTNVCT